MVDAMHHFTPGHLARVVAGAEAIGAKAFVGIDVHRSPFALMALTFGGAITGRAWLRHDAVVSAAASISKPS